MQNKAVELIGIGMGKVVRERNKLRDPSTHEFTATNNSAGYQFAVIENQQHP